MPKGGPDPLANIISLKNSQNIQKIQSKCFVANYHQTLNDYKNMKYPTSKTSHNNHYCYSSGSY